MDAMVLSKKPPHLLACHLLVIEEQQFPVRPFPLAYYVTYPGSIGYLRLYLPSHVGNTPLFEATAREKTAKRSDFVRTLRPDR